MRVGFGAFSSFQTSTKTDTNPPLSTFCGLYVHKRVGGCESFLPPTCPIITQALKGSSWRCGLCGSCIYVAIHISSLSSRHFLALTDDVICIIFERKCTLCWVGIIIVGVLIPPARTCTCSHTYCIVTSIWD